MYKLSFSTNRYKHLKKFQTIHYDIYTHDETVQNDEDVD